MDYYYNSIPKKNSPLSKVKKDIYNCSVISWCHCIGFFSVVLFTNPWPSDFRDVGFYVLLNILIYSFIVNLLNCILLYDKYVENITNDKAYEPTLRSCTTIRHVLFWTYGWYAQIMVVYIGIKKCEIAFKFQLYDLITSRLCFLIWIIFYFYIDVYWLIKSCVYQKMINTQMNNTLE